MLPVKVFMFILYSIEKNSKLRKNQHETITAIICETEYREDNNRFIAMPDTRPIVQPNSEVNATNINRKGGATHCKLGLPLNIVFSI